MDRAVKIDSELLRKVENLVEKEKYKYSSNKQVVNLAIVEFLNSHPLIKKSKEEEKHG